MLKRYVDYSNKELAAMSDSDISKLIDIECMVNGVTPLVAEPAQIERIEVSEPDVQVFHVEAQDCLFTDMEEAKVVADLINNCKSRVTTSYDYDIGYEYKYIKRENKLATIDTEFQFSKEVFDQCKGSIMSNKKIDSKNKELVQELRNHNSEFNGLRDSVINAYNSAVFERAKYLNAKKVYMSYLDISDGDEDVAKKFFKETEFSEYLEEIIEDVDRDESCQAESDE